MWHTCPSSIRSLVYTDLSWTLERRLLFFFFPPGAQQFIKPCQIRQSVRDRQSQQSVLGKGNRQREKKTVRRRASRNKQISCECLLQDVFVHWDVPGLERERGVKLNLTAQNWIRPVSDKKSNRLPELSVSAVTTGHQPDKVTRRHIPKNCHGQRRLFRKRRWLMGRGRGMIIYRDTLTTEERTRVSYGKTSRMSLCLNPISVYKKIFSN